MFRTGASQHMLRKAQFTSQLTPDSSASSQIDTD